MPKKPQNQNKHQSEEFSELLNDWDQWSPNQLVEFLQKAGLGEYGEIFLHHKISGRLAPLLCDLDLKEMGISCVGDRLRIRAVLHSMETRKRYAKRTKVWWEGTEQLYISDAQQCCCTCGGLCPDDPSTYKLTSNHLKVKIVNPVRCGRIQLCCCYEYGIDNVDLSKVDDVNMIHEPAPCIWKVCCCAGGRDHIHVQTQTARDDELVLRIQPGKGEEVTEMILNQIEENQMLERDI